MLHNQPLSIGLKTNIDGESLRNVIFNSSVIDLLNQVLETQKKNKKVRITIDVNPNSMI